MSLNHKSHRSPLVMFSAALMVSAFALTGCGTDDDTFVQENHPKMNLPTQETATLTPAPVETPAPVTPPVQEVTYEIAENAFLNARYDEAVTLFTRYTERESKNPWGYYMLGLSAWKDGQLETAETAFGQSLELDPNHLKSCINLSRVLMEHQRASEALAVLDRALEIDSTSGTVYRLRGNAYSDLNQVDDAIEAYRTAIRLDPTDAWAMNNLAFVWIQQDEFEKALPALARATELRKDVPVFFNNLGMALEHTGHYTDATQAYAFAADLDGTSEKASLNRNRVSAVRDDPAVPAVDLAVLASDFETEIESWGVALNTPAPVDSVVSVQPR